jgi:hypothetical protein
MSDGPRYRTVYTAPAGVRMFQLFGALIMLPFGALVSGALVVGGADAAGRVLTEGDRDPWSLLRAVPLLLFGALFGLFLAYALLRHGFGSLLDAFGAARTLTGEIEARRIARGTKSGEQRYVRVAGEEIKCPRVPFDRALEGTRVRVRFGRFERELSSLEIETA